MRLSLGNRTQGLAVRWKSGTATVTRPLISPAVRELMTPPAGSRESVQVQRDQGHLTALIIHPSMVPPPFSGLACSISFLFGFLAASSMANNPFARSTAIVRPCKSWLVFLLRLVTDGGHRAIEPTLRAGGGGFSFSSKWNGRRGIATGTF